MEIKKITYRRVFNLGNYETVHIELTAEVQAEETPKVVLDALCKEAIEWKKGKEHKV